MSKTKKAPPKQIIAKESWYSKYNFQLIISIFTFLLFSNSFLNDYNLDDELVTRNHRTTSKGISAIPEIFTTPYYQDDMGYAYEYRPIVHTTFAIEHTLFGESPFVGHLVNLLLYIGLCLIVFGFLKTIGCSPILALYVTLLFSAHSAHTEVVCSIKNRDEILGLLFSIGSMILAIKWGGARKWIAVVFAVFLFMLAMLSKGGYILFSLLIPLAVVLFTSASFGHIVLFTFVMSLIGYFLLDIPSVSSKNLYLICVNLLIWLFYLWVRRVNVFHVAAAYIYQLSDKRAKVLYDTKDRSQIRYYVISSISVFFIVLVKYFFVHEYYLIVLMVFLVLILGLVGSYFKFKTWNLEISILTALGVVYLAMFEQSILLFRFKEVVFGILVVAVYFSSYAKSHFSNLPKYTLLFLILVLGSLASFDDIPFYVFFGLLFLSNFSKYRKWLYLILLLFFFGSTVFILIQTKEFEFRELPILEFSFAIIMFINHKTIASFFTNKYVLLGIIAVVLLSIFQYFSVITSASTRSILNLNVRPVINQDLGNAVEVLKSTKTDRPLSYIEYPLPPGTSLDVRVGTAFEVIGCYIQKTVCPYPLAFYYGYQFIKPVPFSSPDALLGIIVFALLSLAIVFFIRVHKQIAFGFIILLSSLAISSGFFMAVPGVIGDRYLFVATLGWSILLGYFVFYLLHRIFKISEVKQLSDLSLSAKTILAIPLLLYSAITFSRNFDWKDHLTLMRKDISYVSNSAQAHNLLALNIMKVASQANVPLQEKTALTYEAASHFKRSLSIYPKTFNVAFDLGRVYSALGNTDSALIFYKKAVLLDSSYNQLYLNIGELLYAKGELALSLPYFTKFMELTPTVYDGYGKVSFVYYQLKDYESSIAINKRAAEKFPNLPDPYINIGQLYLTNKQNTEARFWFLKADSIAQGQNQQIKKLIQSTQTQK